MRLARAALVLALAAAPASAKTAAERAQAAISGYTVHSVIGPIDTPLAADLTEFLLDHPDLASDLVRAHKIAPYRITMLGPRRSQADDGYGIHGTIELLELAPTRRLYFADGVYDRPALPTIKATAVIIMTLAPSSPGSCRPSVRSDYQVYVRLHNPVLATLVRTLRPFLSQTAVSRFARAFVAAQKLGELIAREPDAVFAEIQASPSLSEADRALARSLAEETRAVAARCLPSP